LARAGPRLGSLRFSIRKKYASISYGHKCNCVKVTSALFLLSCNFEKLSIADRLPQLYICDHINYQMDLQGLLFFQLVLLNDVHEANSLRITVNAMSRVRQHKLVGIGPGNELLQSHPH